MATTASFQNMINQFCPNSMLKEEFRKRNWIIQTFEMDNSWKTGELVVPFRGAQASSVEFGALPSSTNIAESQTVRGAISTCPELWGALKFNHRDLMQNNVLSEQSLLKVLPDEVDDFLNYVRLVASLSMLNGSRITKATADGAVGGTITVANPERLVIGQQVEIDDDNSPATTGFVRTINMNTRVVTIYDARTGGAVVDLSAFTTSANAGLYFIGAQASGFTSLKASLLPASVTGGSTNLYGVAKTAWPYLQAIAADGTSTTPQTFVQDLFDFQVTVRQRGRGNPDMAVMSYRNFGYVMTQLELTKGPYNIVQGSQKVSVYGFQEIQILGPKGMIKLVGLEEMDDDYVMLLDKRAIKIYSNGGFRKRQAPDGREYFEVRNTTGYQYIVDTCFFGDIVLERPSYCGIMHSIP